MDEYIRVRFSVSGWRGLSSSLASVPRVWRVLALGGFSALVYWVGLVLPYNVFRLGVPQLLDIAKLTRQQPLAQASWVLTFAVLSGLYYLLWRVCRGRQPRSVWAALLVTVVAVNALMLWLYPIGAADVFDNIFRGRMMARGENPFYQAPRDVDDLVFFSYIAWKRSTSAYGPLWEGLAGLTSRLAGDGVLANLLGFKLLSVLFYGGTIFLIAFTLRRNAPERALQGVCLFALNPLVIYETAGNAHNDVVMAFFLVLAAWWVLNGRYVWSAVALTAGALIKFIPVILLPIVLVAGLRAQTAWRPRVGLLVKMGAVCAILIAGAYLPFWQGGDPLALERRARLFSSSLPAMLQVLTEGWLGREMSQLVVSRFAYLCLLIMVGVTTWRVWRARPPFDLVQAFTGVLVFYLLFAVLWFQPWYAIWPLALAALLPEGVLSRTAVLLSYASLWKAIIFNFFLVPGKLPPRLWREMWLAPATLGIVWLYALYAWLQRRWNSAKQNPQP